MNLYCTEINAICPITKQIKTFGGPNVPGISFDDAQNYCDNNSLGYCKVIGLLITEIPCKGKTFIPDFDNLIEYDKPKLN